MICNMNEHDTNTTLYPAPEVAKLLGASRATIYQMNLRGEIDYILKSSKRAYVTRESLVRYVKREAAKARSELGRYQEILEQLESEK